MPEVEAEDDYNRETKTGRYGSTLFAKLAKEKG
jgi:hypothetical protein